MVAKTSLATSSTGGENLGQEQAPFWTNESVLALAGESADPVDAITERARLEAMRAMEKGWSGPPFDPFELAERLKVPLVPRVELADARTVPVGAKKIRIEFNPTRPRGRLRFSIAHELAHTFFPDAAEAVRNRGGTRTGDDWQLELLCNIAAAELLMPIGSFPQLVDAPPDIGELMRLRKRFDVSTEALLRRVVRLAEQPLTFFSASRIDGNRIESQFRIEYWVRSKQWEAPLRQGGLIPRTSVLRHCSAIGFSDTAVESWGRGQPSFEVQCVGVPPYPGQQFPRVVGLLRTSQKEASSGRRIHFVDGDATQPRGEGPKIIAHLVNDATANWGGPFARALKRSDQRYQEAFKKWAEIDPRSRLKLGNVHFSQADEVSVATMIAQHGYGRRSTTRFSYVALKICLDQVAGHAAELGASVHMPRIGSGEAGGKWSVVQELIEESLIEQGIAVTVYTLPNATVEENLEQTLSLDL